jgi:modification methylase
MQEGTQGALIHRADSRGMPELAAQSIDLVITSPPYWQIKDYGTRGQVGHGQTLHGYLADLDLVWGECLRVAKPGARLCINVGDQFARAADYGRYHVIPLHAEIICQCAARGFDYLGAIIWRKKTTMNTSGGAVVMGSYPYPPNGIVELDYEYILLFRAPGTRKDISAAARRGAAMTRDEWKAWFSGHWEIGGARKKGHEAPFPVEVPRRLVRMFSLPGDTVLDPFLGTGTTALAAAELGRRAVGYEISAAFARQARDRLCAAGIGVELCAGKRGAMPRAAARRGAAPRIPDLAPPAASRPARAQPPLSTVASVNDDGTLVMTTGQRVRLSGLDIVDLPATLAYLRARVVKKKVIVRGAAPTVTGQPGGITAARVLLKNRLSINAHLLKAGLARPGQEG